MNIRTYIHMYGGIKLNSAYNELYMAIIGVILNELHDLNKFNDGRSIDNVVNMVCMVKYNCYLVYNDRIIKTVQKKLHQQNLIVNFVVMDQFSRFWYGFKDLICGF